MADSAGPNLPIDVQSFADRIVTFSATDAYNATFSSDALRDAKAALHEFVAHGPSAVYRPADRQTALQALTCAAGEAYPNSYVQCGKNTRDGQPCRNNTSPLWGHLV